MHIILWVEILHCSANCEPCDHDHRYAKQGTRAICSIDLHPKTLAKARTFDVLCLLGGLKQFKFASDSKCSQHPASQKGTSYTVLLQSGSIEEPRVTWYWSYWFGSLEVSVANSIPTNGAIQGSTPETMGRITLNYYTNSWTVFISENLPIDPLSP